MKSQLSAKKKATSNADHNLERPGHVIDGGFGFGFYLAGGMKRKEERDRKSKK